MKNHLATRQNPTLRLKMFELAVKATDAAKKRGVEVFLIEDVSVANRKEGETLGILRKLVGKEKKKVY